MPVFDFIRNSDGAKGSKRLVEVNVASIHPNPYQPRATFDEESIAELAQSIQQVGLLQPLLVRKVDDGYELVAGERRLRAVTSLGMEKVACIVQQDIEDESSAMMALIENLQREDLHYLEEAQCYQKLLETYGLTQEELANRLGKSQSSIANKLRLLKLSDEVKTAMTEKRLSERHARALLKLTDDKQRLDAVERIAEKGLSVKETEQMVEKTLNKAYDEKQDGAKPRPKLMRIVRDYRLFMNTINQAVNQLRESGMTVEVEQSDRADGVDIKISVTRK
ncbi:MAG: nucleoid occlusion protein [Christensenellaceae bacterium]|nr:nucleoid occlusion protein [Christensenellaceae bacterium]